jgi:hypothetical protein
MILASINSPISDIKGAHMRYFRVSWTDAAGTHYSDPISTWTSAEIYRQQIGGDAVVLRY